MSIVSMRRCPISNCKFHKHPVASDVSQLKRHLRFDHGYREKQETAFFLGLIDSVSENRNPLWFVESLSDFSKIAVSEDKNVEEWCHND